MSKINYIIAFYLGARMHQGYSEKIRNNKFYFLEKHIEFINSVDNIDLTTFVFNIHDSSIKDELTAYFNSIEWSKPIEVMYRDNVGFSYGAWNDVIKKNLNDFDYFFLNEDDYIPEDKNFLEPFFENINDDIPFVCGMILHEPSTHAAFSCGLIKSNACKHIYERYDDVFYIVKSNTYADAYNTQISFYNYFFESGYSIGDIINVRCLPYMDSSKNKITWYGDRNNPIMLLPIDYDEY